MWLKRAGWDLFLKWLKDRHFKLIYSCNLLEGSLCTYDYQQIWPEIHHICTEAPGVAAGQQVTSHLLSVMWPAYSAPSGGQSDATEAAELVPRDAFLQHYREQRWQSSKWHKLSACIVPNQSSRRALKRSAVCSSTQAQQSNTQAASPHILHGCLKPALSGSNLDVIDLKVVPLFTCPQWI